MKKLLECSMFAGLLLVAQGSNCFAQGTAFTYQGRLNNDGAPANGTYDLEFTLFAANAGGVAVARPVTNTATGVTNGLFLATIDFGANIFAGSNYWLEVAVRTNGGSGFATLSPRQSIAPVPYAIFANTASNVTGVISSTQLPASVVTNGAGNVNISGTFSGNGGAGLTNINSLNGATNRGSLLITTDATHATGDLDLIPENGGGIFMSDNGGATWPYGIFLQQPNEKMVFVSPGQISITPIGPIQLGGQDVGNFSFYVYMQRNGSATAAANAPSYPFYYYTDCYTGGGNTIGVMETIAENAVPGASSATNTVLSFYGQNGNSFTTPNLALQVLYDGVRFPGRTIYDLTRATPGSVYMINCHDKSRQVYTITNNVTFGFTNYSSLANQDCHMDISLYPTTANRALTFPKSGPNFNVLWEGGQSLTNITTTNAIFLKVDVEVASATNIILAYATAPYSAIKAPVAQALTPATELSAR